MKYSHGKSLKKLYKFLIIADSGQTVNESETTQM